MSMLENLSTDNLLKLSGVLYGIQQASFYAKDGDQVTYPTEEDIKNPPSSDNLTYNERRFFVFLIRDEGAIKVIFEHTYGKRETPYKWVLEVDRHYLKELIEKVNKLSLKGAIDVFTGKPFNTDEEASPSHEYYLSNSELAESLKWQYDSFVNLSEKGFFMGIADYVKSIDEGVGFEQITASINSLQEKDRVRLTELDKKLAEDVNTAEKRIFEIIKNKKVSNDVVSARIKDYEMTKDGRSQSSQTKVETLYGELEDIISAMHTNGYKELVSEFVKIDPESGGIIDYKISEYYYPYREAIEEYRSKVQTTIWGAWHELSLVYLVVHKYKELMKELVEKKDHLGQLNYHLYHKEMQNIRGLATDEPRRLHFIKDDYILYINRVHRYILNELNSDPNKNAESIGDGGVYKKIIEDLIKEIKEAKIKDLSSKMQMRPAWEELNDWGANENFIKEVKEKRVQTTQGQSTSKNNNKQSIKELIKVKGIRGKEKKFLQFIANMKPASVRALCDKTGTKNCKSLKFSVQKKLKGTGWNIKQVGKAGWGKETFYQLEFLTD